MQGTFLTKKYVKFCVGLSFKSGAIIVDGDFWHAKGHENNPEEQIVTNKMFWVAKLKRNVERAKNVNELLLEQGWLVLRFWESDVKKNLVKCVDEVMGYVRA